MAACGPGSCSESACRLLHSVQARGQHVGAPQVSELLIRICARIGATESRRRGGTESVALSKVRCWLLGSGAWRRSGLLRKPVSYPGGPPTLRRYHCDTRLESWRQSCERGFPRSRKLLDSRAFDASRVQVIGEGHFEIGFPFSARVMTSKVSCTGTGQSNGAV